MKKLLWIAALSSGVIIWAQEKTETIEGKTDREKPPVQFQKDPQQKIQEPTTQIVTNNAKGAAPRHQTGAVTVDQDLQKRILVALSTGSVGTQGVIASDQLTDIKVDVTNPVVTLKGEVISEKNKEVIGKRVAGLDGVKTVRNELTVNPKAKPARADLVQRFP